VSARLLIKWKSAWTRSSPSASCQSDVPEYDTYICRRTDRVDRVCTIMFATLLLGLSVVTGWRVTGGVRPAAAPGTTATPAPSLVAPEQRRAPVVQVANPFDSTEVFEVPANATAAEARDAIAELLLQRARQRRLQGFGMHHESNPGAHEIAKGPVATCTSPELWQA